MLIWTCKVLFGIDQWEGLCVLPCSLNELPVPPFNVGPRPGHVHETSGAFRKCKHLASEHIKSLHIDHPTLLNYIMQKRNMVLEEHLRVLIKWWIHALIPLWHQLSRDHNIIVQLFFIIGWGVHHMRFGILQECPSWFEEWVQSLERSSIQEGLEAHLCVHIWPFTIGVSHLLIMFVFLFMSCNASTQMR